MKNLLARIILVLVRVLNRLDSSSCVQVSEKPNKEKKPVGRPRQDIVKNVSRPVRWSPVEWSMVQSSAESRGLKVSEFIRQAVIKECGW